MTRKLLCLLVAALTIGAAGAQGIELYENAEASAMVYKAMQQLLDRPAGDFIPTYCFFEDLTGDGMPEVLLGDYCLQNIKAYDVANGNFPLPTSYLQPKMDSLKELLANHTLEWFGQSLLLKDDITAGEPPLFAKPEKARNRFTTTCRVDNSEDYTRIVFKPHVGNVKFVTKTYVERNFDGSDIGYDALVYSLEDPNFIAKMLRGYSDNEARPVVVTEKFLTTHYPLQFSRWKEGEKVGRANDDVKRIIEDYYRGERIRETMWLADLPSGERHFYQVLFEPHNGYCIFALVCIAEGEVASTMTNPMPVEVQGNMVVDKYWGNDIDEMWWHTPSIMCMMGTDEGLELYAVWPSMEGTHYSVFREIGQSWIIISDDYEYNGAY